MTCEPDELEDSSLLSHFSFSWSQQTDSPLTAGPWGEWAERESHALLIANLTHTHTPHTHLASIYEACSLSLSRKTSFSPRSLFNLSVLNARRGNSHPGIALILCEEACPVRYSCLLWDITPADLPNYNCCWCGAQKNF